MKSGLRGWRSVLQTDLYQLTMLAAYHAKDFNPVSTFEMFVRKLPSNRSYLLAAGLEEVITFLEGLRFQEEEVEYLKKHPVFSHLSESFFSMLKGFRFTGDLWAVPEGAVVFAGEPLLRVTAPLWQAQLVETYLLAAVNFSTMVATKASRVVMAAEGRKVMEFGSRRAHGPEAGVWAARAAYVGGCVATSNVEAGMRFGIPIAGTSAHSFIMSFPSEEEAFASYLSTFPNQTTLLIDTYDTLEGAKKAAALGSSVKGVRLDSGDLAGLSFEVREILDRAGCSKTKIVASDDLNEHKIAEIVAKGAPIDLFGVGTEIAAVKDAPALGGVYKLVEQALPSGVWRGVVKNSPGKPSYPGRKQVWRLWDSGGQARKDVICPASESPPASQASPLLLPMIQDGQRLAAPTPIEEIQAYAESELSRFSKAFLRISDPEVYPVEIAPSLEKARQEALAAAMGGRIMEVPS